MKKVWRFLLFVCIVILSITKLWAIELKTDSLKFNRIPDTLRNFYDRDSVYYVLIDSSIIKPSTQIRDSIARKYVSESYSFKTFNLNQNKYSHLNRIKIRKQPEYWMLFVLLGIVAYYAFIRNVFYKSLPVIFQAYWNDRSISQFTRDDNFFKRRNAVMYFILFALVYATLSFFVLDFYGLKFRFNGLTLFQNTLIVISSFYILKFILLKTLGYLFSVQKIVSGYLAIISVSNLVYSILTIPFIVFYNYLEREYKAYIILLLIVLFVFNTVYKYLRSASFLRNNFQFPIFYLFLYLCTFEIMPLLIIYKVFIA